MEIKEGKMFRIIFIYHLNKETEQNQKFLVTCSTFVKFARITHDRQFYIKVPGY